MSDQQPVRVPTDQPYGERQQNEAAQKAVPLPDARDELPPRMRGRPGRGGPNRDESWMFNRPTDFPEEPITEGSRVGPGGGPEVLDSYQPESDRELVLAYLAQKGNADAKEMLSEIQRDKLQPAAPSAFEDVPTDLAAEPEEF